jgi:hypothetical protein
MKAPILLHIPEPCRENWDAMTTADKGRHCNSCNKIVVDFSVMSDRQVLEYFKTTTGKTCGRFHDDQLQRPLIEPQQKSTKWNYFIASILGFIIIGKLAAQDRTIKGKVIAKPSVQNCITKGETIEAKKDTNHIKTTGDTIINKEIIVNISMGTIKKTVFTGTEVISSNKIIIGNVINEKGAAIAGATIKLKGTRLVLSTDTNGGFEIKKLGENNKLTLVVSSIGFETKEIEIKPVNLKKELNIILKEKKNDLEEVILQMSYGSIKKSCYMGSSTMISSKKIRPAIKDTVIKKMQQIFNRESVKIYPNPATKNDIIHISIKDAGEYSLNFFDTQSRLLTVKAIVTNTNNQTTEFQLPSTVATGTYFIRILNKKTQKQVTEKIIVQ